MTPEQTKLVTDNLTIPIAVVGKMSSSGLRQHRDDMIGVANLRLVEAAISWKPGKSDFKTHAYWQCTHAVQHYVRSRASGKVNGRFPSYLGSLYNGKANDVIDWSIRTFGGWRTSPEKKEIIRLPPVPGGNINTRLGAPRKTHCIRGHEYETTGFWIKRCGKYTARQCKGCSKIRDKGRDR